MRIHPFSRRLLTTLFVTLALGTAPVAAVTPTSSAATSTATTTSTCSTPWGSLAKQRTSTSTKQIVNVRSGRHACFDRLVVDINDRGLGTPGFDVRYVTRVAQDGSGATVPLRGDARLRLVVRAPAYDGNGPTYQAANWNELVDVTGYRTFRQVAWAGSFEGQTTIGIGVRARLPMRAFVLRGADGTGHRLIVDVAHRW
jgi:hypothetical protein